MRYVLVTGGVVSGLGKGVTASSIGVVLKACGLRVTSIKIGLHLLNLSCLMRSFTHPEPWLMLVVWSFTLFSSYRRIKRIALLFDYFSKSFSVLTVDVI